MANISYEQALEIVSAMEAKQKRQFANKAATVAALNLKANAADVYTKPEVDAKISVAYKPGGNKTAETLTSALLVAANNGKVYNVSEEFTTTANFVEGAGNTYPAGTNVAVIEDPENAGTYVFDVLPGFVDVAALSATATSEQIQALIDSFLPEFTLTPASGTIDLTSETTLTVTTSEVASDVTVTATSGDTGVATVGTPTSAAVAGDDTKVTYSFTITGVAAGTTSIGVTASDGDYASFALTVTNG